MKNKVILICGVPGTGKSTLAIELAKLLGIDQVISTDLIREVMRGYISKEENPVLFSTTHESWQFFGTDNEENILRGAIQHSRQLYPSIIHLINKAESEGRDIILEGVHLLPEIVRYLKTDADIQYFLLTVPDKEEHFRRFNLKNMKRKVLHKTWYSNFDKISLINNWLLSECKKYELEVIENNDIDQTIKQTLIKNEVLYG